MAHFFFCVSLFFRSDRLSAEFESAVVLVTGFVVGVSCVDGTFFPTTESIEFAKEITDVAAEVVGVGGVGTSVTSDSMMSTSVVEVDVVAGTRVTGGSVTAGSLTSGAVVVGASVTTGLAAAVVLVVGAVVVDTTGFGTVVDVTGTAVAPSTFFIAATTRFATC